jgi:hypothetical protein
LSFRRVNRCDLEGVVLPVDEVGDDLFEEVDVCCGSGTARGADQEFDPVLVDRVDHRGD